MQIQGKRKCELEVENESALEIKIWMVEIQDWGPWEARVVELRRGGPSGSEKEATLSPPPTQGGQGFLQDWTHAEDRLKTLTVFKESFGIPS